MNYQQSLDYIKSLVPTLERPSLLRVEEFFKSLGQPQSELACFHVGGTNGKGSVSTLLASMLEALAYRCGKFTGPHLLSFNERFVVNGQAITPEQFAQVATDAKRLSDSFAIEHEQLGALTWFEFLTTMAILYFRQEQVRYSVFEVGMGGRFDATNILTNVVATVLTNVDLDHMQFLGDTREKIAFEKSGIIKSKIPVVTTCDGAALAVIAARAEELQCPLYVLSNLADAHDLGHLLQKFEIQYAGAQTDDRRVRDFVELLKKEFFSDDLAAFVSGLSGSYQLVNILTALIALAASDVLTESLSSGFEQRLTTIQTLKIGLEKASWPGRFEIFERPIKMILDGAHNPHGAKALRASLLEKFGPLKFVFILSCFENKDADELLHSLLGVGDSLYAFAPVSERKMHKAETLVQIAEKYGAKGYVVDNFTEALEQGQALLSKEYAPYLIATGSFATVREACLCQAHEELEKDLKLG